MTAAGEPHPVEHLHRAGEAIQHASRLLSSGEPEDIGTCPAVLEEVHEALGAFQTDLDKLPAAERKPLAGQAEELRESLEVFAALALQSKAYFDSLASELSRGQVTYSRTSATAFSAVDMEIALMDL
jgi:hypothetical protein